MNSIVFLSLHAGSPINSSKKWPDNTIPKCAGCSKLLSNQEIVLVHVLGFL